MAPIALAAALAPCLNLPMHAPQNYLVAADVTLSDRGRVERIDVTAIQPEGTVGQATAEAVVRALQRCAPYEGRSETVRIELPAMLPAPEEPIVTFPTK